MSGRGRGRTNNGTRGGGRGRGGRGRGGRGRGRRNQAAGEANSGTFSTSTASQPGQTKPPKNGGRGRGYGRGDKSAKQVPRQNVAGGRGRGGKQWQSVETSENNPTNQPPKKVAKKLNGEKGADTHTVSETDRIRFTKMLLEWREGQEERLELPPTLTNTERKFLHELTAQLGMVSKSTGKGENRRIVVSRRSGNTKKTTSEDDSIPKLRIGKHGEKAMREHLKRFPPTEHEAMESKETGASLVQAMLQSSTGDEDDEAGDSEISATLQRLGLTGEAHHVAAKADLKPKRIDLERRAARHQFYQQTKNTDKFHKIVAQRSKLPAYSRQEEIVRTVATHPVTIIQGETGCGKSTQCPQFLLDANPMANIVVTQPRRISAISIAERVAQEQGLERNDIGTLVGYQVRLESASNSDTQLLFVTPGILLRRLQSSPQLAEFSHIVIDEVHERDKYTDFLLITLRDLLPKRPDLRLILMSATLQTELLVKYFGDCDNDFYRSNPPAMIDIEGRTFPVQEFFLENVLEMTKYIDPADAAALAASAPSANSDPSPNEPGKDAGVMSMEELDAELAKLLQATTNGEETEKHASPADMQFTCAVCGQSFPDHISLGMHVAICGGEDKDNSELGADTNPEVVPTIAMSATTIPSASQGDASSQMASDGMMGFEDYDVDETAQVDGYVIQQSIATPSSNVEENDAGDKMKWDGQGLFMEQQDTQQPEFTEVDTVTKEQDQLLNYYQATHDDEQVDTDLLVEVLRFINKSSDCNSAILVFLPGWHDISEVSMLLENTGPFSNKSKFVILPLHSGIPSSDQRKVLQRPPHGARKIVLSTNIAETSLTIDDVAFVVDTGRAKEKDYDPHLKTSTLQATWISRASGKQRKGRAGRTKAGVCFHLFSSRRYQSMRLFRESELLRTPLEEMCLVTKKLGLAPGGPEDANGVPAFLSKAISPPHVKSVSNALELLVELGAMLPETNELTHLGRCLSILSLEPRVGKMVIWSYLLGCARTTAHMAVAMSYKSPFVLPPPHMRRKAEKAQIGLSEGCESDQVTVFNAMTMHDKLMRQRGDGPFYDFCRQNFLSPSTLRMIADLRKNLTRELSSLRFANPMETTDGKGKSFHNRNNSEPALWQAAISAGLYPNVATRQTGDVNFSTITNRKAKIHVSSVNAVSGQPLNAKCQVPKGQVEFVCFGEMVRGKRNFTLSQTTHLSSPVPLLLLCGTSLNVCPDEENGNMAVLNLDNWIVFQCDAEVASGLVVLRKRLDTAFWDALSNPSGLTGRALKKVDRDAINAMCDVVKSAMESALVR